MTGRVTLRPRGPFALAQSVAFLARFAPAGAPQRHAMGAAEEPQRHAMGAAEGPERHAMGAAEGPERHAVEAAEGPERRPAPLTFAFTDDGGEPVALAVSEQVDTVAVDYVSELPAERVAEHAARILSLDVDATAFPAVGERDPVVGELQRRYPGRRPVCFGTPFEAGAWAVLSRRTSMAAAARVKERMTRELGSELTIGDAVVHAFPAPERLRALDAFPGVWESKLAQLRALAEAALAGDLDAAALRAVALDEALARLQAIPGIGPFGAALILVRGAGHPDVLPLAEVRLRRAVAHAYGREHDEAAIAALAEAWRPFRSWVTFLLRNALDEQPELGGAAGGLEP